MTFIEQVENWYSQCFIAKPISELPSPSALELMMLSNKYGGIVSGSDKLKDALKALDEHYDKFKAVVPEHHNSSTEAYTLRGLYRHCFREYLLLMIKHGAPCNLDIVRIETSFS